MDRSEFLARVRQAASAGKAYRVETRSLSDETGYVGCEGDVCDAFGREVAVVGGEVHRAATLQDAAQLLKQICDELSPRSALVWQHELLDRLGLSSLLRQWRIESLDYDTLSSHSPSDARQAALSAQIGITSCERAVAETGSLLMFARPGRERMASLLPPVHIAIVERSQIAPDLHDAIAHLQSLGFDGLPSNAVFITGPSKTGDMELVLTTGVHGPGRWCVVVVG